jgi:hypothetical protein
MVGQSFVRGKKGDNVSSHRWIALKYLHEFPDAVFLEVATEPLLGHEEVWSANLEEAVKRAIMFDPTVGSRSNFHTSFRMQFSSR